MDRFLASIPPGPLVEAPDRVVFLYRGAATDAGIAGDLTGDRREDPMWRVAGTDLFWYEAAVQPDARVNYYFVRDFGGPIPDPRNPWRVPGLTGQPQSSLAMPGWTGPDHLGEAHASRRARLEEHVVTSRRHPGTTTSVKVYVPAGYDGGRERLPLALVLDGDTALKDGLVTRSLDNLIPQRVAPVLVAFLPYARWGVTPPSGDEEEEALAAVLAEDVVPFLEQRYRIDAVRERRAVIGAGFFAHRAASAVFRRPAVFGALGMQSVFMIESNLLGSSEDLLKKVAPRAATASLRIYLDWGLYDRRATREGWDMRPTNARFAAFRRERGYQPTGGQAPEGSGWASWRNRTDRVFGTLFPPAAKPQPAAVRPTRAPREDEVVDGIGRAKAGGRPMMAVPSTCPKSLLSSRTWCTCRLPATSAGARPAGTLACTLDESSRNWRWAAWRLRRSAAGAPPSSTPRSTA